MAHIDHVVEGNTDPIKIAYTGAIVFPETGSLVPLIRGSHNSVRYAFRAPVTVRGHDMKNCTRVEIHYTNIDVRSKQRSKGVYLVDDMEVYEERYLNFSWLVSGNATKYKGSLEFTIFFICTDQDDGVEYCWPTSMDNTLLVHGSVSHDLEILEDTPPDLLEQWRDGMVDEVHSLVQEEVDNQVKQAATELMDSEAEVVSFIAESADWVKGSAEYTQEFSIDGVGAGMMVDVLPNDDLLSFIESAGGKLIRVRNDAGSLTLHLSCSDTSKEIASDVNVQLKFYKVTAKEGVVLYGSGVSVGDSARGILEKLKTVDGPGSGLNADFLDGKNSGSFMQMRMYYMFEAGSDFLTKYKEWVLAAFGDQTQNNSTIKNIGLAGYGDVTGIPEDLVGSYWEGVAVYTGWLPAPVFVWKRNGTTIYKAYIQYNTETLTWARVTPEVYHSSATFKADSWTYTSEQGGFYYQFVENAGIKAYDKPLVDLSIPIDATAAQVKALKEAYACVDRCHTVTGLLSLRCYDKKPSIDFTVNFEVVRE